MEYIALVGTFDTKGTEYQYLNDKIREHGAETIRIDMSVMGDCDFNAEYPAELVAKAGGAERKALQDSGNRQYSQKIMADGAANIVAHLRREGKIQGIISMGGGQGISMLSRVYSVLPIGFPKFMLSPLASLPGKMAMFQGINDTVTMNTIVDIAGLNSILKHSIDLAAASIAAAARTYAEYREELQKPVVGISMFGITTRCVSEIERILMENGYEVLVFHANGTGGKSLEKMVQDGYIKAVLDITPSEVGQNLLGGCCDAGENRMEVMLQMGIPYIVSAGALDVVNFMVQDPIPEKYLGRHFHMHGLVAKVMRTSKEENREIGKLIGSKLNTCKNAANVRVLLPLKGISANDVPGNECYAPEADQVLFEALKQTVRPDIRITELDRHINDQEFAAYAASQLMELYPIRK